MNGATIKRKNPNVIHKIYEQMKVDCQRIVAVGFPEGKAQAYPDGTPVASVAATQVYGDPGAHIPARDFMAAARPAIIKHQQKVAEKYHAMNGFENILLASLGEYAVADIKNGIKRTNDPPLSEYTLEKRREKGNMDDKPLIDTHHMIDSVTYVVRNKE